ncbi:hypothetical protein ACRALDRAFT_1078301 [Sodiomyces alcalophilus JCM 7366]|uniref:uncharacterized protein n=1 Tax=Sodiomyces alcalophilus JCM 7366 TaxID=591952 RepID=UPI0039B4AAF9
MSSSAETGTPMQIAVALYRRDPISGDPRKRKIYQHESYHWGVLIIQGKVYDAYDATDRNNLDPVTWTQENPTLGWWFKANRGIDPDKSRKYLGNVIIGTVPSDKSRDDVHAFLKQVPLPIRHQNPQQSCVTWVANAIRAFREAQWLDDMNVEEFLDWTLDYADRRLANAHETPRVVYYEKK